MSKPITPAEVAEYQAKIFPAEVFDAFNELIAKDFVNGSSTVKQPAVKALIIEKIAANTPAGETPRPFEYKWLNIEEVYRKAGWKVEYDKPGYNETYDAYFVFRKK
jgi:hypothetical protein